MKSNWINFIHLEKLNSTTLHMMQKDGKVCQVQNASARSLFISKLSKLWYKVSTVVKIEMFDGSWC